MERGGDKGEGRVEEKVWKIREEKEGFKGGIRSVGEIELWRGMVLRKERRRRTGVEEGRSKGLNQGSLRRKLGEGEGGLVEGRGRRVSRGTEKEG